MSSYMQMGHNTENLVGAIDLDFDGIILSPVNREPSSIINRISEFREKGNYDIIFDTQLYYPKTSKWQIKKYPYFPSDMETADFSLFSWWKSIVDRLCHFLTTLDVDAVTSPVVVPNKFTDEYYKTSIDVGKYLVDCLARGGFGYRPIQSVLIDVDQLELEEDVYKLASIASSTTCEQIYLIFQYSETPRLEYRDSNRILNILKLVHLLEQAGKKTIVSFCSSDIILYKVAGASSYATGKYFNLRRFSPSRFKDEERKGQQLPYWFEEGLMAFIRQADILRLGRLNGNRVLQTGNSNNCWSIKILEHIAESPEKAWIALSWRQYLAWFCKAEKQFSEFSNSDILSLLKLADRNWGMIDDNNIYMEERKNNGEWIRAWLQAVSDFSCFAN